MEVRRKTLLHGLDFGGGQAAEYTANMYKGWHP
jgi:hypothetical protein